MFLAKQSPWQWIKKQYRSKLLVSFAPNINNLLFMQLIGIALAFVGSYSVGTSSMVHRLHVTYYSGSSPIGLSMIFLAVLALTLASKTNRDADFAFVTNRFTSDMSNILILLTFGAISMVISHLSLVIFRMIFYFTTSTPMLTSHFVLSPLQLLLSCMTAFCYATLLVAVLYCVTTWITVQPISFLAIMMVVILPIGYYERYFRLPSKIIEFYSMEGSPFWLMVKLLLTATICFALALVLNKRLEVRK